MAQWVSGLAPKTGNLLSSLPDTCWEGGTDGTECSVTSLLTLSHAPPPIQTVRNKKKCKIEREKKTWYFYYGETGLFDFCRMFQHSRGRGRTLSWKVAWAAVSKQGKLVRLGGFGLKSQPWGVGWRSAWVWGSRVSVEQRDFISTPTIKQHPPSHNNKNPNKKTQKTQIRKQ